MYGDLRWNLAQQIGIVNRPSRIRRLEHMHFESTLREVFRETQGPLHTNAADGWEQIGNQQDFTVAQGVPPNMLATFCKITNLTYEIPPGRGRQTQLHEDRTDSGGIPPATAIA